MPGGRLTWRQKPFHSGPTGTASRGLGDGRGHHVARAGVDGALADFIERRAEGALLVVGHRGSGKTSSVIAAANRAAGRKGHGRTVIPIMITATSMDKTGGEDHKTLLRSLIWALHRKAGEIEGIDKTLLRRTEELYLDATATAKSYELSQSETRSLAWGAHIAPTAAASFAVPALYGLIEVGLAAAAAAALATLVTKLAWERRASKSSTRLYRRDYGFADMQHDFEALLREYGGMYSIVFHTRRVRQGRRLCRHDPAAQDVAQPGGCGVRGDYVPPKRPTIL